MKEMMVLDDLTRITRRREFEDGLFDFLLAVTFLMLGIANWIFFSPWAMRWYITSLVFNREATIIGSLALPALFILIIFAIRRFMDYIRRTYLWRESGYVKSLRWQVKKPITVIAAVITIIMIATAVWLFIRGLIGQDVVINVLPSSAGVATGIVFVGVGLDLRLRRYIWIGVVGILISVGLLLLPLTFSMSWLVFGLMWFLLLFLSGAWELQYALQKLKEQGSE